MCAIRSASSRSCGSFSGSTASSMIANLQTESVRPESV